MDPATHSLRLGVYSLGVYSLGVYSLEVYSLGVYSFWSEIWIQIRTH